MEPCRGALRTDVIIGSQGSHPMRLGVDFGTTRIAAAYVDRGNYPIVLFDTPDGGSSEWFPPLVAVQGEKHVYGWQAWQVQAEPGWTVVRSVKRLLEKAGPETRLYIGEQVIPMERLLAELVSSFRDSLANASNLP